MIPWSLQLEYTIHDKTKLCILNVDDVMGKLGEVYSAFFAAVRDVYENDEDASANALLLRKPSADEVQDEAIPPFHRALRNLLIAVCGGNAEVSFTRPGSQISRTIDIMMQYLRIIAKANDDLSMWIQEFAVEENGTPYKSRFSPITRKDSPEVYFAGPPNLSRTLLDLYVRLVVASGGWHSKTHFNMQCDHALMLTMNKDLMCVTAFIRVLTRVVQKNAMEKSIKLSNSNSALHVEPQASSHVENAGHEQSQVPLLCVLMPDEVDKLHKQLKEKHGKGELNSLNTYMELINYVTTQLTVGVYPMWDFSLKGNIYRGYFSTDVSDTEESDQEGNQKGEQEPGETDQETCFACEDSMHFNLRHLESMLNRYVEVVGHPCSRCPSKKGDDAMRLSAVYYPLCNNPFLDVNGLCFPHNPPNPLVLCGRNDVCALQFCMGGLCPYGVTGFCKDCFKLENKGELRVSENKLLSTLDDVWDSEFAAHDEQKVTVFELNSFDPRMCEEDGCQHCTRFQWQLETKGACKERQSSPFWRHARPAIPVDPKTTPPATKRGGESDHKEVRDQLKAHFGDRNLSNLRVLQELFVCLKNRTDDSNDAPTNINEDIKKQSLDLKRKQQEQHYKVKGSEFVTAVAMSSEKDSTDDWNNLSVPQKVAKLKNDAALWRGICSDFYKSVGERVSDGKQ